MTLRLEVVPLIGFEPECVGDGRFTRLPVDPAVLEVCGRCQVQDWCVTVTRPREQFSGVCGGKVWVNGRVIV